MLFLDIENRVKSITLKSSKTFKTVGTRESWIDETGGITAYRSSKARWVARTWRKSGLYRNV